MESGEEIMIFKSVTVSYEPVEATNGELEEEQWYWNYNDGELFLLVENNEDSVTIADMTGDIETHQKEGMVFQDDEIGKTIRPVDFDELSVNE